MNFDISRLLPQKYPMLLIDRIISNEEGKLIALVEIREDSFGFANGSIPGWFGVEYMAQAIASYNALNFSKGGEPEIGFLVGVRAYNTQVTEFPLGSRLEIVVVPNLIVDSSGSFHCEIHMNQKNICQAIITTVKPAPEFLQKLKEDSRG